MANQSQEQLKGTLPLLGRILLAALFVVSGLGKLAAPGATIGFITAAGLPLASAGLAIAVAVEIGCSALLVLGLFTRPVAAVMAIFTLATALVFHSNLGDQNMLMHFLKNVSIAGGLLQVVAFGPGRLSVDARRARG